VAAEEQTAYSVGPDPFAQSNHDGARASENGRGPDVCPHDEPQLQMETACCKHRVRDGDIECPTEAATDKLFFVRCSNRRGRISTR
jgi:hypothetical protein